MTELVVRSRLLRGIGPQGATGGTGPQGPVGPAGPVGPSGAGGTAEDFHTHLVKGATTSLSGDTVISWTSTPVDELGIHPSSGANLTIIEARDYWVNGQIVFSDPGSATGTRTVRMKLNGVTERTFVYPANVGAATIAPFFGYMRPAASDIITITAQSSQAGVSGDTSSLIQVALVGAGPRGAAGPAGPQGDPGPAGSVGPQGPAGNSTSSWPTYASLLP